MKFLSLTLVVIVLSVCSLSSSFKYDSDEHNNDDDERYVVEKKEANN